MLAIGSEIRYRITAILEAHWEDFFQAKKFWIRPVVIETVRKLRACRTPALGCHVYRCPEGHEIQVVPHSCKSRFCPTCGKHATDRWADGALNDLLDVPYHHLVLSAPWQLRPILSFNREVGLSILIRAASACLGQWARDQHGMRMGIVTVLHTFGSDVRWHPHVHLLVTEGGLSLDGVRWVQPYNLGWLMSHAGLKKMWKYHVITAFRQAHKNGELRFPATSRFLKRYPGFNWLLGQLGASGKRPGPAPTPSVVPTAAAPSCSGMWLSGLIAISKHSSGVQASPSGRSIPPSPCPHEAHDPASLALLERHLHLRPLGRQATDSSAPYSRLRALPRPHHGEVLLIACPTCGEGLQIPTPYRSHTHQEVHFDPGNPDNAVIHAD